LFLTPSHLACTQNKEVSFTPTELGIHNEPQEKCMMENKKVFVAKFLYRVVVDKKTLEHPLELPFQAMKV
jgi:hypothetical protein